MLLLRAQRVAVFIARKQTKDARAAFCKRL
jgi:hypothetical protein